MKDQRDASAEKQNAPDREEQQKRCYPCQEPYIPFIDDRTLCGTFIHYELASEMVI